MFREVDKWQHECVSVITLAITPLPERKANLYGGNVPCSDGHVCSAYNHQIRVTIRISTVVKLTLTLVKPWYVQEAPKRKQLTLPWLLPSNEECYNFFIDCSFCILLWAYVIILPTTKDIFWILKHDFYLHGTEQRLFEGSKFGNHYWELKNSHKELPSNTIVISVVEKFRNTGKCYELKQPYF